MLFLDGLGNIVTKDEEKTEVPNAFFLPQSLTERPGYPVPCTGRQRDVELDKSPLIQKELVSNLLCYLDKCIMLGGIHLRIFIELEEEFALPMIYHQSWLIREVSDDWWLANVKGKEDLGKNRLVSLPPVPGKVMEQVILSAISYGV